MYKSDLKVLFLPPISSSVNSHRIGWEHLERRLGHREKQQLEELIQTQRRSTARSHSDPPVVSRHTQSKSKVFKGLRDLHYPLSLSDLTSSHPVSRTPSMLATFFSLLWFLKHAKHPLCLGAFAPAVPLAWNSCFRYLLACTLTAFRFLFKCLSGKAFPHHFSKKKEKERKKEKESTFTLHSLTPFSMTLITT